MSIQTTNLTIVPFAQINEPGTYVCNWNGQLIQIPVDGISPSGVPVIGIFANEPLLVTKISNDHSIPVDEARSLAANLDVTISF